MFRGTYGGYGGGIYNGSGTVTIEASTISGNSASGDIYGVACAGGIFNGSGTVILSASTVSGNSAMWAGGIYNGSGRVSLTNSTIAGNQTSASGGGIYDDSGTVTLATSIVAGNSAAAYPDMSGGLTSLGHNLIGNTEGSTGWVGTDLLNMDPKLGPLQDNGGPTMTMAPLTGSPAVDAGGTDLPVDPITGQPLTTDQRGNGFSRMTNGELDIGAVEMQSYIASVTVGWGSQVASVQTAGDGLRLLPSGRQTDAPWMGIQRVQLTLTQPATLTSDDVAVLGASGINYGTITVSGSGKNYTITLEHPIDAADRVTITIGNHFVADFTRRLDILPGDVNDDGVVSASDMVLVRNAFQKTGDPLMIGWCDMDGDGAITITDVTLARKKLGSRLP
jgi:hypothetical protein